MCNSYYVRKRHCMANRVQWVQKINSVLTVGCCPYQSSRLVSHQEPLIVMAASHALSCQAILLPVLFPAKLPRCPCLILPSAVREAIRSRADDAPFTIDRSTPQNGLISTRFCAGSYGAARMRPMAGIVP